ncbi:cholesterol 7-desaturase nvd-like [Ixodes scapularis]
MEGTRAPWTPEGLLYVSAFGLLCGLSWIYYINRRHAIGHKEGHSNRIRRSPGGLPPVFPNGWIPILESSKLEKNKVESISAIGMELVAFRTQDNVPHVMDAYCPHLGAHLGTMGRVTGDCIECPFHGWRFRAEDGVCTHVPYASKVPEFAKVKTWLCRELLGFIFVWHHAECEPPSWEVEDQPEISNGAWIQTSRFERRALCHVQDISENGADIGHLNAIHKPSTFVSTEDFARDAGQSWKGRLMSYRFDAAWSSQGTTARTDLTIYPSVMGLEIKQFVTEGYFRALGPALLVFRARTVFGGFITVMAVTPMGPQEQRLIHLTFTEPRMPWIMRKFFELGNRRMMERDIIVWNKKIRLRNPLLVKEEHPITAFRKWYSQFYSLHSPTWKDVMDNTMTW